MSQLTELITLYRSIIDESYKIDNENVEYIQNHAKGMTSLLENLSINNDLNEIPTELSHFALVFKFQEASVRIWYTELYQIEIKQNNKGDMERTTGNLETTLSILQGYIEDSLK